MALSRRAFLGATAAAGLAGLVGVEGQTVSSPRRVFRHGVASGDPLADRVILWTRVTPPGATAAAVTGAAIDVTWEIAADAAFRRPVARGAVQTGEERDWTVKIDAGGLTPATAYYYRFVALGERSPAGRTKTLPSRAADHVRFAVASCANYPYGFFNAYGRIAARPDLDAVLHLGDYLYEYENGRYGDGTPYGRVSSPDREIISLWDYRTRHAQYKTDPDLQEAHRQHPWIVVWDDHEVANNTWRDGAENHQPDHGDGDWLARRDAAVQAFFEWMPIREDRATRQPRIYRTLPFAGLVDLIMLDTRVIDRDEQPARRDALAIVDDPTRSLLGRAQEQWLYRELAESKRAGIRWQVLGQQVMFAPLSLPGATSASTDTWEGYRPARQRLIDVLENQRMENVVVLTGDVHSSWGYDVPRDPWSGYEAASGRGSLAIEIVAPSITSPSGFGTPEEGAARVAKLLKERPHLKYVDGALRGYVVVDITRERVQADWYYVPTVTAKTTAEQFGKGLVSAAGNPHLADAASPVATRSSADPAP